MGDLAEFECHVTGSQPIKLTWSKENKEIKTGANYKVTQMENTTKLTIVKTDKGDSGQYTCSASNDMGKDSCTVKLNVQGMYFWRKHIQIFIFRFLSKLYYENPDCIPGFIIA